MNQKIITEIMQGMLRTLNNAQLEMLQTVLEKVLFNKEVVELISENDSRSR